MNRRIRAPKVKVIGSDGTMLGVLPTKEALAKAQEEGLDLVEVNGRGDPPVCKIIDYGKLKYEQSKKSREAKKKRATQEIKEIKFRPQIGDHDFQVKLRAARKFLAAGNRIRLIVQFKGRQSSHPETGKAVLDRACQELSEVITIIQMAKMEGRLMSMTVGPVKLKGKSREAKAAS